MQTSMLRKVREDQDLTEPIALEGDADGSDVLLRWLQTHGLLELAVRDNFQRFATAVGDLRLAFSVFRKVQALRSDLDKSGDEPDLKLMRRKGFSPITDLDKAFAKLERVLRFDVFQIEGQDGKSDEDLRSRGGDVADRSGTA